MRRSTRYALRLFVALALIAAVRLAPALISPAGPGAGPYTSALSSLAVSQTFAASTCNYKGCAGGSRHNIVCAKVTSASHCFTYQGYCIAQNCT